MSRQGRFRVQRPRSNLDGASFDDHWRSRTRPGSRLQTEIPGDSLAQIAGMRNILVHDYFRVNQAIVWETVETHLPHLKAQIQTILSEMPNQ
jgi:hypothetical protein